MEKKFQQLYIKYDQSAILSQVKPNIFTTGDSIVDVIIALSERELTQKRIYQKLLEVLRDVEGLLVSFFLYLKSFLDFIHIIYMRLLL